ncbi:MAG: SRPBCC family protein [Pseudomonadota bacterium]|jgi:uncharacterized protein YndB with AHSA1/START domain|uniref:SRPBCC family protein n=2 Tax=Phenylobacterium TaxID=20 RepID=A0ABW3T294_9CAUL
MPGMHAEAHVAVPPERVWALLICFENYPLWTRALALSGKLKPHAPVDYVVPLARPAGPIRRLALPCEVTRLTPGRSLALSFGWGPALYATNSASSWSATGTAAGCATELRLRAS